MKKLLITFFTVLFCLTSSVGWGLEYNELVEREGIFYKKFSNVPFTGKVTGKGLNKWVKSFISKGSFKNGKQNGLWIRYYDNGQLWDKGNYINGKREGYWIAYFNDGKLWYKGNTWKNTQVYSVLKRYRERQERLELINRVYELEWGKMYLKTLKKRY